MNTLNNNIPKVQYKEIKSYNREELTKYLYNLYSEGYESGYRVGLSQMMDIVTQGLQSCEGIGQKRFDSIINSINKVIVEVAKKNYQESLSNEKEKEK